MVALCDVIKTYGMRYHPDVGGGGAGFQTQEHPCTQAVSELGEPPQVLVAKVVAALRVQRARLVRALKRWRAMLEERIRFASPTTPPDDSDAWATEDVGIDQPSKPPGGKPGRWRTLKMLKARLAKATANLRTDCEEMWSAE